MEKIDNNQITKNDTPVYFLDLTVENVRCFGKRQTLDLSNGNGKQARWTVLLGDNGTGKTTLLQCLVGKGRTFYRNDTAYNHINKHLTDNKNEEVTLSTALIKAATLLLVAFLFVGSHMAKAAVDCWDIQQIELTNERALR